MPPNDAVPNGASAAATPALGLVGAAAFASMASMRVCDPLLPALVAEFGTSTGRAAQTISSFAIAYGLLQLFYGPLGDRYGKTRVISFAVIACAAANLSAAFAPSIELLVAARAFAGAAAAGIIPLTMAWIGDSVGYERRQEVLARFMSATIFGMIAGQWVGGIAAERIGWRPLFIGLALLFAAVAVLLQASERRSRRSGTGAQEPPSGRFTAQLASVMRLGWARRVVVTVAIEGAFVVSAFAFVPAHLHERFGVSLGGAGAIAALYGVGGLLYALTAKRLVSAAGEGGLAATGGVLLGIAMAMLAFGDHWGWSLPGCFVGGLGFYMLHNTLQTSATQMAPATRGTAVALFASFLFFGQSAGLAAAAWVVDRWSAVPVFVAGMGVLPVLGWWFRAGLRSRRGQGEMHAVRLD